MFRRGLCNTQDILLLASLNASSQKEKEILNNNNKKWDNKVEEKQAVCVTSSLCVWWNRYFTNTYYKSWQVAQDAAALVVGWNKQIVLSILFFSLPAPHNWLLISFPIDLDDQHGSDRWRWLARRPPSSRVRAARARAFFNREKQKQKCRMTYG